MSLLLQQELCPSKTTLSKSRREAQPQLSTSSFVVISFLLVLASTCTVTRLHLFDQLSQLATIRFNGLADQIGSLRDTQSMRKMSLLDMFTNFAMESSLLLPIVMALSILGLLYLRLKMNDFYNILLISVTGILISFLTLLMAPQNFLIYRLTYIFHAIFIAPLLLLSSLSFYKLMPGHLIGYKKLYCTVMFLVPLIGMQNEPEIFNDQIMQSLDMTPHSFRNHILKVATLGSTVTGLLAYILFEMKGQIKNIIDSKATRSENTYQIQHTNPSQNPPQQSPRKRSINLLQNTEEQPDPNPHQQQIKPQVQTLDFDLEPSHPHPQSADSPSTLAHESIFGVKQSELKSDINFGSFIVLVLGWSLLISVGKEIPGLEAGVLDAMSFTRQYNMGNYPAQNVMDKVNGTQTIPVQNTSTHQFTHLTIAQQLFLKFLNIATTITFISLSTRLRSNTHTLQICYLIGFTFFLTIHLTLLGMLSMSENEIRIVLLLARCYFESLTLIPIFAYGLESLQESQKGALVLFVSLVMEVGIRMVVRNVGVGVGAGLLMEMGILMVVLGVGMGFVYTIKDGDSRGSRNNAELKNYGAVSDQKPENKSRFFTTLKNPKQHPSPTNSTTTTTTTWTTNQTQSLLSKTPHDPPKLQQKYSALKSPLQPLSPTAVHQDPDPNCNLVEMQIDSAPRSIIPDLSLVEILGLDSGISTNGSGNGSGNGSLVVDGGLLDGGKGNWNGE